VSPGVLFRCDGSAAAIGMGHVVRCSVLAQTLKRRGCDVRFAMRKLSGRADDFVRKAGFPVEIIAGSDSEEHAPLTETDRMRTADAARRSQARCLVVDHYGASSGYLRNMKDQGINIAVIDDLADRELTAADWLLNQNLGAASLAYRTRPDCVRVLGPSYALLRPEFGTVRGGLVRKFEPNDRRVLLTFGGGETERLCAEVMKALNNGPRRLDVRCALGGEDAASMAELMAWADLSVNGGGSTCWELCCLGVPMVILALAPDQASNASALERQGCALSLGEWRADTIARRLAGCVEKLLADPERRAAMSRASQALVDGSGAERTVDSLRILVAR
jgi:UDP-2,4-diacetamido-2,4,6-trideoxy-beta-L-altropyranose hydrolase